jgi:hypothetical protein
MVLDNFYQFIRELLEAFSPEEKVFHNNVIVTYDSYKQAKAALAQWKLSTWKCILNTEG